MTVVSQHHMPLGVIQPATGNPPQFSVVIPAYNAAADVQSCLESLLDQQFDPAHYEIILVDDCSTDATYEIASQLATSHANLHVIKTPCNAGPGIARNMGVSQARGVWVMFLDSDDTLVGDALLKLEAYIASQADELDAVGYNWTFSTGEVSAPSLQSAGRRDQATLVLSKHELLKKYLSLHMDGSVIYTAVRRQLIMEYSLIFAKGYHEDVDYIYMVYWHARRIGYLNKVLYYKGWRVDSIVNTISPKHILGFMRAWREISIFTQAQDAQRWHEFSTYYRTGLVGVVATRAREIARRASSSQQAAELYACLYTCLSDDLASITDDIGTLPKTKYGQITAKFISTMQDPDMSAMQKATSISEYIGGIMSKSWSCIDLHHSVFMAPDQIRTCCKRFFVDGNMRGDVALMDVPAGNITYITPEHILKAKQSLHNKINSGEDSGCSGCPFLEFKDWGALDKLEVKYLSFEYHSVCNLKCSYCSDTYFGGKQANYDVKRLLEKLLDSHALDNCGTVVWGGGEPVVGKHFDVMLEKTVARIPNATQRVLTNSVKHNKTVQRLLAENKVSVTTSVDAGTDDTYTKIRGMASLNKAMANLQKYAEANSSQVTVKYIFTEGNCSIDEVRAFISLVHDYKLIDCNFQISCDFKHETIALDAVISMIVMYGLLTDAACRLVFFDDLLRQRLGEAHAESEHVIKLALKELGLGHILADKLAYKSVAIWGAGWQSKYLIENSAFFKDVDVEYFIDSRPSRIGERFMDHDIVGPDTLLQSDIPVVIAAVQNLPLIYKSFVALGLDESRLVKKLIF
ncbi:MAG: glycosyltransferase [Methylotenera sp.]|nr:glycosyltransferase [Methylotenera sp.]